MPTFANITPTGVGDGMLYASEVPLTTTEADLFNGTTAIDAEDPIRISYGEAIQAVVQLVVTGSPVMNSSYVVMQTDLNDGVWIDVAWCMYTQTQAPGIFLLCAGIASNNAFQQTRQANSPPTPQANGSNAMVLGGRIRFVGRTSLGGGSSGAPGQFLGVKATIRYRILAQR